MAASRAGSMCQRWKRFDLQQLQKDLDVAANALTSTQHENEQTRKKLIDQSDELKKHTPEDLHEHITPLLDGFHSEIDVLCERSKEFEAAFLSVYKRLIDVPDPVSALEVVQQLQVAAVKMRDVETENQKLRERLHEYDKEVAEVKEETIEALRDKVESYKQLIQSRTKDEEEEAEDEESCKGTGRLRENESVRVDIATANQTLEVELVVKQGEVVRLMEDVRKLQSSLSELTESTANQIRELQQQLDSKHTLLQELEERLEAQADYDEIKRELRVLRSMEPGSSERPAEQGLLSGQDATPSLKENCGQDGNSVQKQLVYKHLNGSTESHAPASPSSTPPQTDHTLSQTPLASHFSLKKNKAPLDPSCSFSADLCKRSFGTAFPSHSGNSSSRFLKQTFGQNPCGADPQADKEPDTAEIARRVKEQLMKHNIGQRVFGHYVLGLSQGSVSEILARPKPWNKLTVRGKEPFLKMKHFLSDERNILSLTSIQGRQRGSITSRVRVPESGADEFQKSILDQARKDVQGHKIGGVGSSVSADRPVSVQDSWREQWWSVIHGEQNKDTHTREDPGSGSLLSETPVPSQDHWREQTSSDISNETLVPPSSSSSSSSSLLQTKPVRASMMPLTCEQYERFVYQDVDTVELTQQVKEKLAKSGICQRVFGEKVLGLSQGSVSDMLSRPKQWNKLTQKGREPFIRMQLWIEGELQDPMMETSVSVSSAPETPDSSSEALVNFVTEQQVEAGLESHDTSASLQELDTYSISRRVREVLSDNNLGQRLFGEAVLGVTQGSVCDLLARPKPWHRLSVKGREPYVQMQRWLKNPSNIHTLHESKHAEKKGYLKRHMSAACEDPVVDSGVCVAEFGQECVPQLKRSRVVISAQEKEILMKAYEEEAYPSPGTVEELAQQLQLKASTVNNWFHNYRSRIRRRVFMEAAAGKSDDITTGPPTEEQDPAEDSSFNFPESSASPGVLGDSSLRRRKAANLNSIIHRLEQAVSRDEPHDGSGGGGCESQDAGAECVNTSPSG